MSEETKYVDEDYLLSHGFERYNREQSFDITDMPFFNDEDWHYREKEFDRNMFVIIFSEPLYDNAPLNHQIYVQEDAGCGFACIPERWAGLPVKFFEAIYYGIRGEYPKQTT